MHIEIAQAVDFIGRLLQSKVNIGIITIFKESLVELLKQRYKDHWDVQQPYRGNAYRALSNFNGELDPILLLACNKASCSSRLIYTHLPRDFVLWIDPFSVSYRVGDHGNIMTLYEDRTRGRLALKMDPGNTMISPSHSPRLHYLQPQSTPIRISPPSSPENKKIIKAHLHQPSPLAMNAKKEEAQQEKQMILAN
ncbi:hypothetical protein BDB01DRAFT_799935 [Pilobolus umbonatus]|nr:hypothetical protein BDB01DRAFT_799935 [Pilobolus umbonatus]